ncbi:hypothetical protein GCM10011418_10560 [Sphingobacterium alkalisoli]|nr:hypothetical protein GCM10011418_10560 [Sphingobacterium alkalisoli]
MACNPSHVEPELIIDPVEDIASLSVINVSNKTATLPDQLNIDGLFGSSKGIKIGGPSGQTGLYEDIQAGLRKFSIGEYTDSLIINKHNYYTLMVYNNDSVQLHLDAPYSSDNQFIIMPSIRWNLIDGNPAEYRVDIMGDSLIRDIDVNKFTYVPSEEKKVELQLYRISDLSTAVDKYMFEIDVNKKFTVNISRSGVGYTFNTIAQTTK